MINDDRPFKEEFNDWQKEADFERMKTKTIIIIIAIILLIIILKIRIYYGTYILVVSLLNALKLLNPFSKNIDFLTCMRKHTSIIWNIISITLILTNPTNLLLNMSLKIENKLREIAVMSAYKLSRKYAYTRRKTHKIFLKNEKHNIDDYWKEKGLNMSVLNEESTNVIFETKEPLKQDSQVYQGVDMRDYYDVPKYILMKADAWGFSDLSDEMHAKSLHKRIAARKEEYKVKEIEEFNKNLIIASNSLQNIEIPDQKLLLKALATPGTAGQFAKRSVYEKLWKDQTAKDFIEVWESVIGKMLELVLVTNYIPENIIGYMLYRKREILPIDENGKVKITRLMNSPNLVARIADSVVFGEMNEAIILGRKTRRSNVGINIFTELKQILIYDENKVHIEWDISDFDGGQCAMQLAGNCMARVNYGIKNKKLINKIMYLIARYERHMNKEVKSTWGIIYRVLGQQASGDITTSDDNSEKSNAFCMMLLKAINNEIKKLNLKIKYENKTYDEYNQGPEITGIINHEVVHGDDGNLTMVKPPISGEKLKEIIFNVGKSIGWKVKPEDFAVNTALQDGKAKFLSHGVKLREIKYDDETILTFAVIVREKERLYNKWCKAAELDNKLTAITKSKLVSKYLSFTLTSLGHPEIIVASMYMLMQLRAPLIEMKGQYSWMGLSAKTINDITLDKIVTLQLPLKTNANPIGIKLYDDEYSMVQEVIIKMVNEFNELNEKQNNKRKYRKIEPEISDFIKNDFLMVNELVIIITMYYEILEKMSAISKPKESERWWEMIEQEERKVEGKEGKLGKLTYCQHIIKEKRNSETTTEYNVGLYCATCWEQRKEKFYEKIYVKITKG